MLIDQRKIGFTNFIEWTLSKKNFRKDDLQSRVYPVARFRVGFILSASSNDGVERNDGAEPQIIYPRYKK